MMTHPGAAPLPGFPADTLLRARPADRLPAQVWAELTTHEPTRRRYLARMYRRDPALCWYWLGAISDTGHGKLRAGSRAAGAQAAGEPPSRVVTAHVYGWHLVYGAAAVHPRTTAPLIAHRCDECACQNPAHWRLDDTAGNTGEYMARRVVPHSPLADRRGPDGRARAIAAAIRTALEDGSDTEAAIAAAAAAGLPAAQERLF
jgi:hypothetical protein